MLCVRGQGSGLRQYIQMIDFLAEREREEYFVLLSSSSSLSVHLYVLYVMASLPVNPTC